MTPVETLVAAEAVRPLPEPVTAFAAILAQETEGTLAVLFYGSCLRDGIDGMLDFYVLTDRPRRLADRLLPPSVFFREAGGLRAKVAVMPLPAFRRAMRRQALSPHLWARFCQPTALAWSADEDAAALVRHALADALGAAAWWAERLARPGEDPWRALFRHTYASELRAERPDRPRQLVDAAPERWARAAALAFTRPSPRESRTARRSWAWRKRLARLLAALRLVKAAFTAEGGADYLAWKIERHGGGNLRLNDWQRRHPLLAAVPLLLRLRRRGIVR